MGRNFDARIETMAIGVNKMMDELQALAPTRQTGGENDPVRMARMRQAFDMQMKMAQSLFQEPDPETGEVKSMGGFDSGLVNDSLMLDAISTINRIFNSMENPLPRRQSVAPASSSAAVNAYSSMISQPPTGQENLLNATREMLGGLSAKFESGAKGIEAVGYDRVGGTSYGKYQLASKVGTMDRFIDYLASKEPQLAERLKAAGDADTGSKTGAMPEVWKAIAKESPERFEQLQHDFIARDTYDPARKMIMQATGYDLDNAPGAVKEVLWSTAVQHGPTGASQIFQRAIDTFVGQRDGDFNSKLIENVYDKRKTQFGSSTERVRQSVQNRLEKEKTLALNMLGNMGSRIV